MSAAFSVVFPASWRGVPFAVEMGERRVGRRKAVHDYPYRDGVYIEDLGRAGRMIRLQGFLLSNSALYGGGDVLLQAAAMERAAEQAGAGLLVHPTRGPMLVDLVEPLVMIERWDEGHAFELQFSFMEGLAQAFPTSLSSLVGLVSTAVGLVRAAASGNFVGALSGLVGVGALGALGATVQSWAGEVLTLSSDASLVFGAVSLLGGANHGRYFNGANAGFRQALSSPYAGDASVDQLVAQNSLQRAAVAAAATGLAGAVSGLGATTQAADVAAAASALAQALGGAAANPADGVRQCLALAAYDPGSVSAATPAGQALGAAMRRGALAAAAEAANAYAPSSADDAATILSQVVGAIDVEILAAGDAFDDASFEALRALRQAVFTDLGQRGAALPAMSTVQSPAALPAAVWAQRLYQDSTRRDELVTEADPPNPLFMPARFRALAS